MALARIAQGEKDEEIKRALFGKETFDFGGHGELSRSKGIWFFAEGRVILRWRFYASEEKGSTGHAKYSAPFLLEYVFWVFQT